MLWVSFKFGEGQRQNSKTCGAGKDRISELFPQLIFYSMYTAKELTLDWITATGVITALIRFIRIPRATVGLFAILIKLVNEHW